MNRADVEEIGELPVLATAIRQLEDGWESGVAALRAELDNHRGAFDAALGRIDDRKAQAETALASAEADLVAAQSALAGAQADLGSCLASGTRDEPPECSSEESAVSDCETAVAGAESRLEQAREILRQTQVICQKAMDLRAEAFAIATAVEDRTQAETAALRPEIGDCLAKLQRAHTSLEAYAASSAAVGTASPMPQTSGATGGGTATQLLAVEQRMAEWLGWKPPEGLITPDVIAGRLRIDRAIGMALARSFIQRDPLFAKHVQRLRQQVAQAQGPMDLHRAQQSMRCHLTGRFSELLVRDALAPLGKRVDEQRTEEVANGRSTRLDLVLEGVRQPVLLGRGGRSIVPQGSDLAIEVKSGGRDYLLKEMEHMCHQASGHRKVAGASAIICTRDIEDLDSTEERMLRDRLRDAGSPMLAMLPRKSELDLMCAHLIRPEAKP